MSNLEAEAWRDAVLTLSCELDTAMQGPSASLDDAKTLRRTVYGTVSRQKPADLFRQILLRNPTSEELSESLTLVRNGDGNVIEESWTFLAHSLLVTNEFLYVE